MEPESSAVDDACPAPMEMDSTREADEVDA
eukprot:COSAG02_NODE_52073_length_310_cov_0.729858_1_plen_29_part_10